MHQAALGTYIDPIRTQYARARPNFWSARQSVANFLVRAVATLCRLDYHQTILLESSFKTFSPKHVKIQPPHSGPMHLDKFQKNYSNFSSKSKDSGENFSTN